MPARSFQIRLLLGLLLAVGVSRAAGQNSSTPPNVLLQLMQSQMPVDLNSPVTVKAEFDPPFVAVGQTAIYRVTLNALESAVKWPENLPVPAGLKMMLAARGQIMPVSEGMFRPQTALNFRVVAERPGFYTVPALAFEVYGRPVRVPPAILEVTPEPSEDQAEPRRLFLLPARTNLFVGESLSVRVVAPGTVSNLVDTLTQLQFNGDGFLENKNIAHQQMEAITVAGKPRQAWVVESSVTPVAAGPHQLSAQAFTGGFQFAGPVVLRGQISLLGGAQKNILLDSEPVVIHVQPLPPEGNARGFTGFIGKLSVDRPQLSTNSLRIGDVLTVRVTFRGYSGFSRFSPPPAPRVAGWQVFPPTPTDPAASPQPAPPYAVAFTYAMIPASEDVSETPAIPFHYFDPEKAAYVDASIPAMKVKVQPGDLPADWKTASAAFSESPANRKLTLSPLATTPGRRVATLVPLQLQGWFGWLQLAPALLFGALWYWDRRRRFLEAHPEVVRCREARRALRRERRALRHAAVNGDAAGFVRRAVAAMQVAAAPHFPAAPRALVCGEVLSLFDATEQGGRTGDVIRQFFAREMDTSYSQKPAQAMPLFDLRPEMESILTKLEARL